MSQIKLVSDRCTGCGECIAACLYNAVTMENGLPIFGDACNLCGACAEACPSGAIEVLATAGKPAVDKTSYRDIWVFGETRDGQPAKVVLQLLGAGRSLADQTGQKLCAVLIGDNLGGLPELLIAHGADRVLLGEQPALAAFRDEPYTAVLASAVNQYRPSIILFGATAAGRSLAPRLAARLRTGLTADCTGLSIDRDSGDLLQTRPAFGGNIMAAIVTPNHRPQLATVRPGVLKPLQCDKLRQGEVIRLAIGDDLLAARTEVLGFTVAEGEAVNLEDASIIVAGGRGLGSAENFELVKELASLLGGAVGASRAAVDEGWISYAHQVGQTGKTVSPRLFIACGISGAIQHLVGMQGSEIIVAINKNPDAPIFKAATYGLIGDAPTILKELIAQLQSGA
ncbi:MAG: electron transfer flavoprotein subunit alpha [Thermacetogeniaceae bacterium]